MSDLGVLQDLWGSWADKTFPKSTLDTIASHFREESIEFAGGLKKAVTDYRGAGVIPTYSEVLPSHDPEEAADCLLLMLHHAHKHGYNLFYHTMQKAKKNMLREWDIEDNGGHGHFKHKEES